MLLSEATNQLLTDIKAGLAGIPQYLNEYGELAVAVRKGVKTDSQEGTNEENHKAALFATNIFITHFRRDKKRMANGLYSAKHTLLVMVHTATNDEGKPNDADVLLDVVNSVLIKTGKWIVGPDMIVKVKKDQGAMLGYVGSLLVYDRQEGSPFYGTMPTFDDPA